MLCEISLTGGEKLELAHAEITGPAVVGFEVTIGVVLTCLNFTFIRHLVQRMLVVHPDKRGATAFFFVPKMAALLVAAALAIFFLPISAIGLGIGFSVFLLSIMVESIRFMTGAALIR